MEGIACSTQDSVMEFIFLMMIEICYFPVYIDVQNSLQKDYSQLNDTRTFQNSELIM
jgi:hypothetical protein